MYCPFFKNTLLQVKRFSGEASENLVDDGKTGRCCTIL